jgi:uncharacterized delta-60 repeat protein
MEVRLLLSVDRLDPTFDGDGRLVAPFHATADVADAAAGLVVQPDGNLVVASAPTLATPVTRLFRYLPDGTPDPAFGIAGRVTTDRITRANDLLLGEDGKLLVVGVATQERVALARFNSDGRFDPAFGSGGVTLLDLPWRNTGAVAADVSADGDILVTGYVYNLGETPPEVFLARFNPDGTLDPAFGDGVAPGVPGVTVTSFPGLDWAKGLAELGDGRILVAGNVNGGAWFLYRFTPDGRLDADFGQGGAAYTNFFGGATTAHVTSFAMQGDKPVLGGFLFDTNVEERAAIARFNPDGTLDSGFDGDGWDNAPSEPRAGQLKEARALDVDEDGDLLVVGSVETSADPASSRPVAGAARYRPDGSLDAAFGNGGMATVDLGGDGSAAGALACYNDGRIALGGVVEHHARDGGDDVAVARLAPDGQLDLTFSGDGKLTDATRVHFAASSSTALAAAWQADGKYVVAGRLKYDTRGDYAGVARFNPDGSPDGTFGNLGDVMLDSAFEAAAVDVLSDGKILVALNHPLFVRLVRLNFDGSPDVWFGSGGTVSLRMVPPGGSQFVTRMAVAADGKIVLGGILANSDWPSSPHFAFVVRLRPDGSLDNTFDGDGILTWGKLRDPVTEMDLITDLFALPDGRVLVATSVLSNPRTGSLRRFLGDGRPDPSFGTGGSGRAAVDDPVSRAELLPDGRIVTAGSVPRPVTAPPDIVLRRFNPDGSADATFGTAGRAAIDIGPAELVGDLLAEPDGGVLVGGTGAGPGTPGAADGFFLAHVTPSGQLATGEGAVVRTGFPSFDPAVQLAGLLRQPSGNVVAYGTADRKIALARFTAGPGPRVRHVYFSSSGWAERVRDAASVYSGTRDGYSIAPNDDAVYLPERPPDHSRPLQWAGLDRITIRFDQDVTVKAGDLTVTGSNVAAYGVRDFSYDPATRSATWTLTRAVTNDGCRLTLAAGQGGVHAGDAALDGEWWSLYDSFPSGNGIVGGDFEFPFNVLVGDVNKSRRVDAADVAVVKSALAGAFSAPYRYWADVTGDGRVNALDVAAVKARLGSTLPATAFGPRFSRAAAAPADLPSITRELFSTGPFPG